MAQVYKKFNNITGWLVFAIATVVYVITSEPTVSLWDCGEYIATAYKLQVGHPPGAPFFQLLGNFFSIFAFGNEQLVARMVNTMSALASSFTILFLFWSITHLAKKLINNEKEMSQANMIAVLGSGVVGALAYTFSDSFWFSAVEGEVYALSSFFTAFVFWAILKWENVADERHGYRWLILIAYMIGLSIGVHLLNLLAIPAIAFVYYFKKYKSSTKGIIFTGIISILLLAVVMYLIIPLLVSSAGVIERFFVNRIGMPFHSGTIVYFIILIGAIAFGLYYTHKHRKVVANTIILAFTVITIGYSSFFILVVRSNANTPIDENNPEDALSLLAYLNREQYGDWPLFHGQYFNAPVVDEKDGNPFYTKSYSIVKENKLRNPGKIKLGDPGLVKIFRNKKDAEAYLKEHKGKGFSIKQSYVITDERKGRIPVYDDRFKTIFPRMWSRQRDNHPGFYRKYIKDKSNTITVQGQNGKNQVKVVPSFADNLRYFFQYQIGHMYMRYFMWNFSGRQNNMQGFGDDLRGNWISGIKPLDEARLGPQDETLPVQFQNNPGTNKYYMLPLLLGLIGLYFQFAKRYKDGIIVTLLFVMTGLAIVVYLNQYPNQPRERDYAYAASFYAFAIWIGLGVLAIYTFLKKFGPKKIVAIGTTLVTLALVPGIMAQQNWDDHDRSGRYNALHIAKNYLNSCEKNAILFTNGDNDTFPLWYAQEVEGIRTDIKIVNLSLFNTDWYVDQMVRKTYDADPIPVSVDRSKYIQGTNDVAYFIPNPQIAPDGEYINIRNVMDFFWSDSPKSKFTIPSNNKKINYFPTKHVKIPVDKEKVIKNGTVKPEDSDLIEVNGLDWKVKENVINKNHLMMMEMIASFNWDRPVYFAITTGPDTYLHLMKFFQLDGMTYRLVPIETQYDKNRANYGRIDTDILYDRLMNVFIYADLHDPDVYLDEYHMHSIRNYRNNFARLANALADEGKNEKAIEVLDKAMYVLPEERIPYDYFVPDIAEAYYKAGADEKGKELLTRLLEIAAHDLQYYYGSHAEFKQYMNDKRVAIIIAQKCNAIAAQNGEEELQKEAMSLLQTYASMFQQEGGY